MPRWTKPAFQDLEAQLTYIERENPALVSRIALRTKKAIDALETFPHLGRPGVVEGTRGLVLPQLPFVCVYRIRGDQVEILRILHERMQWPQHG